MYKLFSFVKPGSIVNQLLCAFLLNIATFAYGTCIGWTSPMILLLQSQNSPKKIQLTDQEVSWIAAIPYLISVPANYLMAFLGDRFGRKQTVMFMSASCAILWTIKLVSLDTWALVLARCLVGICMSGSCITCPVYLKELSEMKIRGALTTLVSVFYATGTLFSFIIGDLFSYNTVLWICLAIPIFHILLLTLMPESPSYLMKHGKIEEASTLLAWLRCRRASDAKVQEELAAIQAELANEENTPSKFIYKAIFSDKILLKAFEISMMVVLAREICGALIVVNFASEIFQPVSKNTGLTLSANQQAMILGAIQICGTLLASTIVEVTGRKPLLITTSSVSGISMCVLGSWFVAHDHGYSGLPWLPVLSLCVCIFCDSSGLMPMSVVIQGELFSYKYRSLVFAVTMAVASLLDFLLLIIFKFFVSTFGIYYLFYFFGIMCLLNTLYVVIVLPETKKKTLDEIYDVLRENKNDKT